MSEAMRVMELRRRTGLQVMRCKAALVAAGGDTEAALEALRREVRGCAGGPMYWQILSRRASQGEKEAKA
jgi:translation elongation factor EF-Ts